MSSQYTDFPPIRVGLSLKLGIFGGVIWGLIFTAYYSMLPDFKFASESATICFVLLVVVILSLPIIRDAIRNKRKKDEDED
jgi:hypothetical protein